MNNKAHLRPKDFDSNGDIIPMACKEEKGDLISREVLKKALIDAHINMKLTFDIATFNCVMNTIDNAPTVSDRSVEIAQKSMELGRRVGKAEAELYCEETCKSKDSCDDYNYWHCVGCNGCKKGGAV